MAIYVFGLTHTDVVLEMLLIGLMTDVLTSQDQELSKRVLTVMEGRPGGRLV